MRPTFLSIALSGLALGLGGSSHAQGMPTSQPGLITIVRETVKLGRAADHEVIEAGWPAAYEKAQSPVNYLALSSMTGVPEVWYVVPFASHAAIADDMKREDADPVLAAELARLSRADAEVLESVRTIQAMARPDLSYGAFPDLAMERFFEITLFRVRPGHEGEFDAAAKAYGASAKRVAPESSYRVYQVIAGLPGPTYLVFASVPGYAAFDAMMARGMKTMQSLSPEEMATLQKFAAEGMINAETNRYRVSPGMSYVDQATRARDPGFWSKK